LLPPGASLIGAVSTASKKGEPCRDAQLFDAVWSSVIEGLGRNGQPERANKAFEDMLGQLSADSAASATGASTGKVHRTARGAVARWSRDARLFDAYLRAGVSKQIAYCRILDVSSSFHFFSAASADFLFPHVLDIFDIMSSYRCSASTHTYPSNQPISLMILIFRVAMNPHSLLSQVLCFHRLLLQVQPIS
jgi:pentatricopeptide repeat protein